jgi:hypothetical protein
MIYLSIELQLKMIREDLAEIKRHINNHYPMMSWPCCPDCGDESCFKFSKCVKKCPDCEFAKSLGLGQTTCTKHAPEFAMRISFPME